MRVLRAADEDDTRVPVDMGHVVVEGSERITNRQVYTYSPLLISCGLDRLQVE